MDPYSVRLDHFGRAIGLGLGLSAVVACSEATGVPRRSNEPVQTDSLVYHLQRQPNAYRAWVVATYRNNTDRPVFFTRCGTGSTTPMFGVTRAGPDSTRKLFVDFAWACVGDVPEGAILPGQEVSVRVTLGTVDQLNMKPPLQPEDLVGLMRINLLLCSKSETEAYCQHPLPLRDRWSNTFLVSY